jgi:hypothetical protein
MGVQVTRGISMCMTSLVFLKVGTAFMKMVYGEGTPCAHAFG